MISAGRVVNLAPEDFWVLGAAPLTVGVAAVGGDDLSTSISFSQGSIYLTDKPKLSVDYSSRIPNDLFQSRFDISPGLCKVSVATGGGLRESYYEHSIQVFDKPGYTASAINQSQLLAVLTAIQAGSYTHAQVSLSAGSYSWPSEINLSSKETLVSFVAGSSVTFNLSEPPAIKWARWIGCRFSNPAASAFVAASGSRQAFDKCAFSNSVSGLVCMSNSNVRLENCHVSSVVTGVIGAKIIRGLSWTKISGTVFQNCPVIENTFGFRDYTAPAEIDDVASLYKRAVWSSYEGPQKDICIRNNLVFDDYSILLRFDTSVDGLILVGNSFESRSVSPIILRSVQNAVIFGNTVEHTGKGSTIIASGSTQGNVCISNWLGNIGTDSRRLFETANAWKNNSYVAPVALVPTDTVTTAQGWQNNYHWLSASSILRFGGVSLPSVKYIQGVLYQGQIGALPNHPDATLTHIYKNYRQDVPNGMFLPAVVVL